MLFSPVLRQKRVISLFVVSNTYFHNHHHRPVAVAETGKIFAGRKVPSFSRPLRNSEVATSPRTFPYGSALLSSTFLCCNLSTYESQNLGAFSQVHYDRQPDTVYAVSSGHGKCAVAIIRISGSVTESVVKAMTKSKKLPKPRQAQLCYIYDPQTHETLDHSLVLWFPGKASFTGEDSCELQVHGGIAVVNAVLSALSKISGVRHAEAGEFTKRAFINGKLDLTEVEGLADLIHAETEAQRKQAFRQMGGALTELYSAWRQVLVKCLADVEAFIDFSEDQNIEENVINQVLANIEVLINEVILHLEDNRRGERLRTGVKIAIIGEPNVGKSSFLNILCQRPAAIVSPIPGTTRDIVETALDIGGFPVVVSDTAGLRKTNDIIEQEGVRRALQRADESDLKLLLVDSSKFMRVLNESEKDDIGINVNNFVSQHLKELGFVSKVQNDELFVIVNKSDLLQDYVTISSQIVFKCEFPCHFLSCVTKEGFHELLNSLQNSVRLLCANPSETNPSLTHARQRALLENFLEALEKFMSMRKIDIVLAGEELRQAQRYLGKVTGKITTEEILDVIFRDFCIGK